MNKIGHLLKPNLGIAPLGEIGTSPPAGLRWGFFKIVSLSFVAAKTND
jgi:hypothetical protein